MADSGIHKTAADYENSLCEAILAITQKQLEKANFDRTIQATVVECVDEATGKYKCKYQDGLFYAFSNNIETKFSQKAEVYVHIPANDTSSNKLIIGSVKGLGDGVVSTIETINKFYDVGTNILKGGTFKISSYAKHNFPTTTTKKEQYIETLYKKGSSSNRLSIDAQAANQYIKKNKYIKIGANFQTKLADNQTKSGNYGIAIQMNFQNTSTKDIIIKNFILDTNAMTGNPYHYELGREQFKHFEINGEQFVDIESISIFTQDFPNQKNVITDADKDIIISDLTLICASAMSDEEVSGGCLVLSTPKGNFFRATDLDNAELEIKAEFKVKGKVVSPDTKNLSFYWFYEDVGVLSNSEKYCIHGGKGWSCLNNYYKTGKNKDNGDPIIEWQAGKSSLLIPKKNILTSKLTYKCVAVYDETSYSKEIEIENLGALYSIILQTSDGKTSYNYDNGKPDISCIVKNNAGNTITTNNLKYSWAYETHEGTFYNLPISESENRENMIKYLDYSEKYSTLKNNIDTGKVAKNEYANELQGYENSLKSYKDIEKIGYITNDLTELKKTSQSIPYGNILYSANIAEITQYYIYKCSIYTKGDADAGEPSVFIGTGTIQIKNEAAANSSPYSLVINNGKQVFKYDEFGVSPISTSIEKPQSIQALSFNLLNKGEAFEESVLKNCKISWKVPNPKYGNTLFNSFDATLDNTLNPDDSAEYLYYNNVLTLGFKLDSKYDWGKIDNDIELTVTYQDQTLTAYTNFTFVKEGSNGTNGTEYICKIVPNTPSPIADYPVFTLAMGDDVSGTFNFTDSTNQPFSLTRGDSEIKIPFRAELHCGGEVIYSGTSGGLSTDGNDVTVKWSILQNVYKNTKENYKGDYSDFSIDETSGAMKFIAGASDNPKASVNNNTANPCNIIKCEMTYGGTETSLGQPYKIYAVLPIIKAIVYNDNYKAYLKRSTGIRVATFSSDGRRPQFSDDAFVINVEKKINNVWEDVSVIKSNEDANGMTEYQWSGDSYSLVASYDNSGTLKIEEKDIGANKIANLGETYDYQAGAFKSSTVMESVPNLDTSKSYGNINEKKYSIKEQYDGVTVNNAVKCIVKKGTTVCATMHIPIHCMLNQYGFADLNDWDGNSVTIDEEGGHIIAPRIGAGLKHEDNTFSGVYMGALQEADRRSKDIGILGLSHGKRSFFLDAEDGSAYFGVKNGGRIMIDPIAPADEKARALIYSDNFFTSYTEKGKPTNYTYRNRSFNKSGNGKGEGMIIDFSTPEIFFGSGKFYVTKEGYLHAQDGGQLAGWKIGLSDLVSFDNKTGLNGIYIEDVENFSDSKQYSANSIVIKDGSYYTNPVYVAAGAWDANKWKLCKPNIKDVPIPDASNEGTYTKAQKALAVWAGGSSSPKVYLTHDGYFRCKEATVGNGSNTNLIYIGNNGDYSTIHTLGKNTKTTNRGGFYIGTDGFSLGSTHSIDYNQDGNNAELTVSNFQVDNNGTLYAKNGFFGSGTSGWKLNDGSFSNKKKSINGSIQGVYLGTDGLGLGGQHTITYGGSSVTVSEFQVNSDGTFYAKKGYIGASGTGWAIKDKSLQNNMTEHMGGDGTPGSQGVYLGTDGIGLGHGNFYVNSQGFLHTVSGDIGGISISSDGISSSNENGGFSLSSEGRLICTSGNIGGWEVTPNGFKIGDGEGEKKSGYLMKNNGDLWVNHLYVRGGDNETAVKVIKGSVGTPKVFTGALYGGENGLSIYANGGNSSGDTDICIHGGTAKKFFPNGGGLVNYLDKIIGSLQGGSELMDTYKEKGKGALGELDKILTYLPDGVSKTNKLATKSDIPSLEGYATKTWVSSNYQPKGNYALSNHSHSEYAASSHSHSEYAASSHSHDNYAETTWVNNNFYDNRTRTIKGRTGNIIKHIEILYGLIG